MMILDVCRCELLVFSTLMGLACAWMMDALLAILLLRLIHPSNILWHSFIEISWDLDYITFSYNCSFVLQAIRKQPMTVYGDGKQTRSFQYVSDLVWLVIILCTFPMLPFSQWFLQMQNDLSIYIGIWIVKTGEKSEVERSSIIFLIWIRVRK